MKPAVRLQRRIVWGGAALVAAFVGFSAYDGWRLHEQIVTANERELGNLAMALSGEAARSLQAVDVLLRDTASWYETFDRSAEGSIISGALQSRAVGVPQVSVLSLVDASGLQRFHSRVVSEPLADVSDRPYFQKQREGKGAGLFINEPVVTRTERMPGLIASRRLSRPDGSFDGVVTAIVRLEALESAYSAIRLGQGSALLLALEDGTLVVRQPAAAASPRSVPEIAVLKGGELIDRMVSPVDGRRKFVAVVGVGDLPLILAITRDEAEALRPWHDEMWSAAVRTLMVSILVALTIFALLRQLRRLAQGALALKQSEERYAMVMEAANEGHAEWNFGNDRLFASQKWRALHGLDHLEEPERHQGSFLSEVALHGDDESTVAQTFAAHLAGQTASVSVEYRVLLREGAWRWIHTRGRCLFDGTGHPTRLFCSATDVTERKEAEIERERLRARLQQNERLEALGTLAGGIAHDFNNILGAILGFGELAQQHADAGSVLRRYIDRVMQGGARARLLVRRILDFSRSGVIERTDVHVQAVVEEVVAMLTPTLPAEVIVEAKLDAGLSAVSGDSTQLYQVIMNLCSNAVQAIAAGASGKVSLSLYCVQVCESRILLHSDLKAGPYLCLDVQDSGMGISSEVLQRIFEPFYTTKKQGEGTGLGLSVVHGVVSDLGGAIDVVSTVGVGTTVSVWLPVSGECKPHPLQEAPRWPEGHGEVVAIVDDDRALVELAEESLANLGYEAVGFDSAESALAAFQDAPTRFDAVLTDENLSGISGTALAQALWSLRPDLPVILMSGKVDEALLTRAHEAGLGPVLRKPLTLREMSNRLSEDLRCH